MSMEMRLKWQGKAHRVQKHKHAGKGLRSRRFPAVVPTFPRPGKGKISITYTNAMMRDLRSINSALGFWIIRRIGGFLFNQRGNSQWRTRKWTKLFGVKDRVPFPVPLDKRGREQKVIAENVLCDGNKVTVEEIRGKYARIRPQRVQLFEVGIKTGEKFPGGLYWYVYPDPKTRGIWIEKDLLEKIGP